MLRFHLPFFLFAVLLHSLNVLNVALLKRCL
jgi:hypothetical protein